MMDQRQVFLIAALAAALTMPSTTVGLSAKNEGYQLRCSLFPYKCHVIGTESYTNDEIIEEDIIIQESEKGDRNAIKSENLKWPGGKVPYVFHRDFNNREVATIKSAFGYIQNKTCVKFVSYDPLYHRKITPLYITRDNKGCFATLGYNKKKNIVNLNPNACNWKAGVMHHELLHSLGMSHEQSRPDRDEYVTIITKNISPGHEHNFVKSSAVWYTTFELPYDFKSVLHYSATAFSKDQRSFTIVPKNGINPKLLGQRVSATEQDLKKVRLMYKCPTKKIS